MVLTSVDRTLRWREDSLQTGEGVLIPGPGPVLSAGHLEFGSVFPWDLGFFSLAAIPGDGAVSIAIPALGAVLIARTRTSCLVVCYQVHPGSLLPLWLSSAAQARLFSATIFKLSPACRS